MIGDIDASVEEFRLAESVDTEKFTFEFGLGGTAGRNGGPVQIMKFMH